MSPCQAEGQLRIPNPGTNWPLYLRAAALGKESQLLLHPKLCHLNDSLNLLEPHLYNGDNECLPLLLHRCLPGPSAVSDRQEEALQIVQCGSRESQGVFSCSRGGLAKANVGAPARFLQ